jgi:transcriptional regulator with XRE-family HTH domain
MYKINVKKEVYVKKIEESTLIVDMGKFIGIKLAAIREAANLNQADLSKKTIKDGAVTPVVSRATISTIESGKGNATMATLSALAKALNINVFDLLPAREDSATQEEIDAELTPPPAVEKTVEKEEAMEKAETLALEQDY